MAGCTPIAVAIALIPNATRELRIQNMAFTIERAPRQGKPCMGWNRLVVCGHCATTRSQLRILAAQLERALQFHLCKHYNCYCLVEILIG